MRPGTVKRTGNSLSREAFLRFMRSEREEGRRIFLLRLRFYIRFLLLSSNV